MTDILLKQSSSMAADVYMTWDIDFHCKIIIVMMTSINKFSPLTFSTAAIPTLVDKLAEDGIDIVSDDATQRRSDWTVMLKIAEGIVLPLRVVRSLEGNQATELGEPA